jgi:hypothetical protein
MLKSKILLKIPFLRSSTSKHLAVVFALLLTLLPTTFGQILSSAVNPSYSSTAPSKWEQMYFAGSIDSVQPKDNQANSIVADYFIFAVAIAVLVLIIFVVFTILKQVNYWVFLAK